MQILEKNEIADGGKHACKRSPILSSSVSRSRFEVIVKKKKKKKIEVIVLIVAFRASVEILAQNGVFTFRCSQNFTSSRSLPTSITCF